MKLIYFCLFLSLLGTLFVSAEGIFGVSPSTVEFKQVLRGGYAERPITVSFSTDKPVKINLESAGEIAGWLNFSENVFNVSYSSPAKIVLSVRPPEDVPNGNYTGFVRISSQEFGSNAQEGHAAGTVLPVLDVVVNVEITDLEVVSCSAGSFTVISVEKGDSIVYSAEVLNSGNVRLKPNFNIKIWDQDQVVLIKDLNLLGDEILPTRSQKISFNVPSNDLDFDQYWTDIEAIDCFSSGTLTFDVLEPGTLKAEGILVDLSGPVFGLVGDNLPFVAFFRNTGEKNVVAQFRGQIMSRQKVISVLESEEISTPINEMTNFTLYFTPEEAGDYLISGRIFYDKKRTYEDSHNFKIYSNKSLTKSVILFLAYALIIFFLGYVIYRIHKERARLKNGF